MRRAPPVARNPRPEKEESTMAFPCRSARARLRRADALPCPLSHAAFAQGFDRRDVTRHEPGPQARRLVLRAEGPEGRREAPRHRHGARLQRARRRRCSPISPTVSRRPASSWWCSTIAILGASEGEPRGQIFPTEQLEDYRNAITWTQIAEGGRCEPHRRLGHSLQRCSRVHLGAFDRRIKAWCRR